MQVLKYYKSDLTFFDRSIIEEEGVCNILYQEWQQAIKCFFDTLHIADLNLLQYEFHNIASVSSQDFPGTMRSFFADCFWRTFFVAHKKMHSSEYVWKACLKELGILLKWGETFEKFLAACNCQLFQKYWSSTIFFTDFQQLCNYVLETLIS